MPPTERVVEFRFFFFLGSAVLPSWIQLGERASPQMWPLFRRRSNIPTPSLVPSGWPFPAAEPNQDSGRAT